MKFICPLIVVKDIKISKDFYETLLDQKIKYDFGENVTFKGDFAIHLLSHFSNLIGNKVITSGGNNFELYFEYDDVDQIVSKLKSAYVVFVHELREQPWRQKVVRFYDPDLHIVEIGESLEFLVKRLRMEGLNINEIVAQTGLPLDFVTANF